MITAEQFKILSAPFAPQDHEFKQGFIYLTEEAVCARIEQVDLSWGWVVASVARHDPKGMIATTIGHLTICDVTRSGEGSQMAEYRKGTDIESGEIEKGSETDALKRAARKFGIGRYLLDCPKEVKGYGPELNKWLASLSKSAPVAPPQAPAKAAAPVVTVDFWTLVKDTLNSALNDQYYARAIETMRKLYAEKRISESMSVDDVYVDVITAAFNMEEIADNQLLSGGQIERYDKRHNIRKEKA